MTTNKTVRMTVSERAEGELTWRVRSTYESGSEADAAVHSLEEVWHHAAAQGLDRNDVVFRGSSYIQLTEAGLVEFRNEAVCPACARGTVVFDPLSVVRSEDNLEWFTTEVFDHQSCRAMRWAWHRGKDAIRVVEERTP